MPEKKGRALIEKPGGGAILRQGGTEIRHKVDVAKAAAGIREELRGLIEIYQRMRIPQKDKQKEIMRLEVAEAKATNDCLYGLRSELDEVVEFIASHAEFDFEGTPQIPQEHGREFEKLLERARVGIKDGVNTAFGREVIRSASDLQHTQMRIGERKPLPELSQADKEFAVRPLQPDGNPTKRTAIAQENALRNFRESILSALHDGNFRMVTHILSPLFSMWRAEVIQAKLNNAYRAEKASRNMRELDRNRQKRLNLESNSERATILKELAGDAALSAELLEVEYSATSELDDILRIQLYEAVIRAAKRRGLKAETYAKMTKAIESRKTIRPKP